MTTPHTAMVDLGAVAVETLGWLGSGLLIVSILQKKLLALRVLSLVSSVMLAGYNVVHGVLPMVAVNLGIVVVNCVYLFWPRSVSQVPTRRAARQ